MPSEPAPAAAVAAGVPFGEGDAALAALFDLLSDETRLRIVSALAAHAHAVPDDPSLGFAALRQRVGARDSGRFNYHLRKLDGTLVERTQGGYALSRAGRHVVSVVSEVAIGAGAIGPGDEGDA